MNNPKLHIVHCVDTEGPLQESLDATFDRLHDSKGFKFEPSDDLLKRLQNKEIDLDGREEEVADYLHPRRLAYLNNWVEVSEMVSELMSEDYRKKYKDTQNSVYKFSWFIIDVVGYKNNPRNKDIGFHHIWDKYIGLLKNNIFDDCLGWHFHTVPVGGNALEYNSCWTNNDYHEQVLCRRIIERGSFPSIYRAGGTIERNDLSYWLEQFIPFDFSCVSTYTREGGPGWNYDWRHSPKRWGFYHPDFYDYRKVGNMKRAIFRCLDVDTLHTSITIDDVLQAFEQVQNGETTILAVSGHDRRDLRPEVEKFYGLVVDASKKFKDIKWVFSNALEAAKDTLNMSKNQPPKFTISIKQHYVEIVSDQDIFGPIPFLAIEEENKVFFRANPTIENSNTWVYKISRPSKTKAIGVAASNISGDVGVQVVTILPNS